MIGNWFFVSVPPSTFVWAANGVNHMVGDVAIAKHKTLNPYHSPGASFVRLLCLWPPPNCNPVGDTIQGLLLCERHPPSFDWVLRSSALGWRAC